MVLRKRHRARVEPHVENFRHTAHFAAAGTAKRKSVDMRTVQVVRHTACFFLQFGDRADDREFFARSTFPYGKWCTPVAATADGPILQVFEPFSEPALANVLRLPVNTLIFFDERALDVRHGEIPRVVRVVEKRGPATPAQPKSVF